MDPGIVAEAIQAALASAGVKTKQVVTAVGGRDVIIKKIQIERVKEQQARELMRWEAEQHVPFDMESVELDFQILDPDADGVEMSVLLVAAKRELIESKMRMLTDAGLEPGVVDVDAFALHNAFEVNHPDAMNGVVGAASTSATTSRTSTFSTTACRSSRATSPSARAASAKICSASAASRPTRRSSSFRATIARRISTRCSRARGEEIAVGIERAAAFLAQNRARGQMRAIYTCGGGSRIPGLNEMLAERLRLSVQQANPLANLERA